MAQQLGIKVKVNLPSKSQLEEEFRSKWKDFKADFTAKVNVSADQNSLRKMKTQITKVFDGYNVTIKPRIDVTNGAKDLSKLLDEFLRLKTAMEKTVHINIDNKDIKNGMNTNVAEKYKEQSKIVEKAGEQTAQAMKRTAEREIQSIDGSLNRLVSTTRRTAKGVSRTLQESTNDNEFVKRVVKASDNSQSTQVIYDQKAALNQLKAVMKEIAGLETKVAGSTGGDKTAAYSKRIEYLKDELKDLLVTYKRTFSQIDNAGSGSTFNRMQSEVNSIRDLNVALAEAGRKAKAANDALKELTRIENSKFQLSSSSQTAGDNQKAVISQQIAELNKREQKIRESAEAENLLTSKEKEQLSILRTENSLRLASAQAKAEDRAKTQAELQSYRQLKSDLTIINRLEKEKANLEGKTSIIKDNGAYESRLQQIKSEISARRNLYDWEKKNASESGKIGSGASKSLSSIEREAAEQANLNRQIGLASAKIEQSDHYYNQLASSISRATSLQAEMSRAGSKEAGYIKEQVRAEQQLQGEIRHTISSLNLENSAREKQIATQRAASESSVHYSTLRSKGKTADSKHGLSAMIDPFNALQQSAFGIAAAIGSLEQLDTAMVRVTKVVNAPKREMEEFTNSIYKNASAVGKSATEYSSAVEQWATAGYSLKESTKLAKDSVMGSFVGDIDVNDMVKYMAVPLNAFKSQMLSSKDIINAMNQVSNKNAVEMDDLGQAYSKASAQVSTTGTSFSQLTGLITAAQEGTRAGGDVIGRAIKSISINLDNMGTGLTKVNKTRQQALEGMGIHFRDSKGQLKSTYQILGNIHKVWGSLSKDQKAEVSYYVAGKEQATQFQAIIKNWGIAAKATKEAQNQVNLKDPTTGSAFKEFEREKNSVQFHLTKLKNDWTEFLNSLVGGRQGMNTLIDGADKLVNKLDGLAKNKGLLSLVKTGAVIAAVALVHASLGKLSRTIFAVGSTAKGSFMDIVANLKEVATQARVSSTAIDEMGVSSERAAIKSEVGANGRYTPLENEATTVIGGSKSRRVKNNEEEIKSDKERARTAKETSSTIVDTTSREAGATEKVGKAAGEGFQIFGKSTKLVMGLAKGVLGLIPILGDLYFVWQIMDALNIHPLQALTEGANQSKEALSDLNKQLDNVNKSFNNVQNKLNNNQVINGTTIQNMKDSQGLGKTLDKGEVQGANKLDDQSFQNFKQSFNSLAKKNHIKLRVTLNNFDILQDQLKELNEELNALARKNVKVAVKDIGKETSALGKTESKSNIKKMYEADKKYASKEQELKDKINNVYVAESQGQMSQAKGDQLIKQYTHDLNSLNESYKTGAKNAELWHTAAGKSVEKQWNSEMHTIQGNVKKVSKTVGSGAYSKEDYNSMDKKTLDTVQVAQGENLRNLQKKQTMIDDINNKMQNGGKLTAKEVAYLAKQNKNLENVNTSTKKWTASTKQQVQEAVNGGQKQLNSERQNQEQRMRDIMEANGVSKDLQDKTIAAYEKGKSSYIQAMSLEGNLGKSMLNLSAEFAQQYGKNWAGAYEKIQKGVDKVPKTAVTKYAFIDTTTGLVDTHVVAKLNQIPKKKGTKYGLTYDKNGHVQIPNIIKTLNKIPALKKTKYYTNGVLDAGKLIDDLVNHTNRVPPKVSMAFLADTVGFNSETKQVLKKYKQVHGKKATVKFLADNKYFGLSAKEVNAYLDGLGKKKTKTSISADTKKATGNIQDLQTTIKKIKGKSVNMKANTKTANKEIKTMNNKIKDTKGKSVKMKTDTKTAVKSLDTLNSKIKKSKGKSVSMKANTSSANKSISSLKSTISKIKGKSVSMKASTKGKSGVEDLRQTISKTNSKNVTTRAHTKGKGSVDDLRGAISKLHDKDTHATAHAHGKGNVNDLRGAVKKLHDKDTHATAHVHGRGDVADLLNKINNLHSKDVNINVSKTETTTKVTKHKSDKSVAIAATAVGNTPAKNLSVAIGDNKSGLANVAKNNIAVKDFSDSSDTNNNTVSEDVWRYWGQQLYTGDSLSSQVTKLEDAVTKAKDDMDSLIRLSKQRIDLDNRQISYQNGLKNSYQNQLNDVLRQLKGYGFSSNGNQITNLSHAQSFKGDSADKVNNLLDTYKTAYENIIDVANQIESLNLDKWQQQDNIAGYQTTKETNAIDKLSSEVDTLTTTLSNNANILSVGLSSLSSTDYAMNIKMSGQSIADQTSSIQQLLNEFNKLSTMTFQSTDNAKTIQSSLENIKSAILSDADAILTLRQSINDAQINQIATDLDNFTTSLSNNIDQLKTNVTDLQEGLLNGQSFDDLQGSNLDTINFNQADGLNPAVQARLSLEQQLDTALDNFAKKDVNRTANVANSELQIQQNKYSQLLGLAQQYSNGQLGNVSLNNNATSVLESLSSDSSNKDLENNFVSISQSFADKLNSLKSAYSKSLSGATNQDEKDAATQQFIVQQLKLQEDIYNSMIDADKKSIAALKEKLNLQGLTSEQIQTIKSDISNYETAISTAQTNIKSAIKDRFDYENTLMQNQITKYKNMTTTIENMVSLAKTLNLDTNAQGVLLADQYASTFYEYDNYLSQLKKLRDEQSQYGQGTYEYNLLQTQVDDLLTNLQSTVSSLADINKTQFSNSLTSIQKELEKMVYGGLTSDQQKLQEDLYYTGVDKELELESLRLKANDLENNVVAKRMEALDQQKNMSKIEADYLDKEIDLQAAKEKLDNVTKKKDVQVLSQNGNGNFEWTYEANQSDVESAQKEYTSAAQEVQSYQKTQRDDYLSKVEAVISGIQDGSIDGDDAKNRLDDLNNAYGSMLGNIPTFDGSKVNDIISAYNNYVAKNKDILDTYGNSTDIANTGSYQELLESFSKQFKEISKDLGDIFGKQIRTVLELPDISSNVTNNTVDSSKSVSIQSMKLELPNVEDTNTFVEALKTLPEIAVQAATKKQ